MPQAPLDPACRVLLIDEDATVHGDFRRAVADGEGTVCSMENLDTRRGATERVRQAAEQDLPFAAVFLGFHGRDVAGLPALLRRLLDADERTEIVLCADPEAPPFAIETPERVLLLRKPLDEIEIRSLLGSVCARWRAARRLDARVERTEAEAARLVRDAHTAALRDPRTGLAGPLLLAESFRRSLERSRRSPSPRLAVLALDLGTLGATAEALEAGARDRLLAEMVERLARQLRPTDLLSSGEAFISRDDDVILALLDDVGSPADALRIAERLLDALEAPWTCGNRLLHPALRAGISLMSAEGAQASDLVREAREALARARAGGQGRAILFDRALHAQARERIALEHEARDAFARDRFLPRYQPIMDLGTGRVLGVEVLLRQATDDGALRTASEILPLLASMHLLLPATLRLLEVAAGHLAAWRRAGLASQSLYLNLNLPPEAFAEGRLSALLDRSLRGSGLSPCDIVLDIPETMSSPTRTDPGPLLHALRQEGYRLHLDSLGVGPTHLTQRASFPYDGIKLDRALLAAASESPSAEAFFLAILGLARACSREALAKGVDDLAVARLLERHGVRHLQGNLISPPLSESQMRSFLSRSSGGPPETP